MHDEIWTLSSVGQKFDAEAVCKLFKETKIYSPDWVGIGNQLGLQLKGQILAADFFDEWCAKDSKASWLKLAMALQQIPEYQHAARNIREKQGILAFALKISSKGVTNHWTEV